MSRPTRKTPPPATRERLLQVAERLFAERGFAGTSVRQVTEAAGANLGAINYHFQTKANLYTEVYQRRMAYLRERVLAGFRDPARFAGQPLERTLLEFGQAFVASHEDPKAGRRVLDLFLREQIEGRLPAGLIAREIVAPAHEVIVGLLRLERPDLDDSLAEACATALFAQLTYIVKLLRASPRAHAARIIEDRLAQTVRFTMAAVRHI